MTPARPMLDPPGRWVFAECPSCGRRGHAVAKGNPVTGHVMIAHGPIGRRCPGTGKQAVYLPPRME